MKRFKNTTFREGYNPTFSEFKKAHKNTIDINEMEVAYEVVTGKKPKKKDGNTTRATNKKQKPNASEGK